MNQNNNGFSNNIQGNNEIPNNEPVQNDLRNTLNQNNNFQQQSSSQMKYQSTQNSSVGTKQKKKKYWLIPILVFTIMVLTKVIELILQISLGSQSDVIKSISSIIFLICGFAFWPSIIIAIVLSVREKKNK